MKKFLLIAAVIILGAANVNAQYKPEKMTVTAELNYAPAIGSTDSNGKFSINEGFCLPEYGAKFRLFLNENMAIRLKLGFNTNSTNNISYQPDSNDKEQEYYDKNTKTTFSFMPGFEYHFSKFERVSPYVGAEIGFLIGSKKIHTENTENDNYTKTTTPFSGFAFNAVTGFDVYVCKGLYLGAELGLGYMYESDGRYIEKSANGNQITEDKGSDSFKESGFGFYANPSLRIGWCF